MRASIIDAVGKIVIRNYAHPGSAVVRLPVGGPKKNGVKKRRLRKAKKP